MQFFITLIIDKSYIIGMKLKYNELNLQQKHILLRITIYVKRSKRHTKQKKKSSKNDEIKEFQ